MKVMSGLLVPERGSVLVGSHNPVRRQPSFFGEIIFIPEEFDLPHLRFMEFNQGKAIYLQIVDWMGDKILRGEWPCEGRIPSLRDVAMLLQVNPNTAMRAYDHLQNEGIIYNKRGIGYFVETDGRAKILKREKEQFLTETLPDLFCRMEVLGITTDDLDKKYENYKTSKR